MDIEIDLDTSKEMEHSLISDLKNTFPETKCVPDRWKLGLSDEEMTDLAKHHLGLTNFKGVIPKDHIPVFTQYVIEAAPVNRAHDILSNIQYIIYSISSSESNSASWDCFSPAFCFITSTDK